MNLLDYIPHEHTNPHRLDIKYLLRKRIFHRGYQLYYCYLPYNDGYWVLLTNTETKQQALNIIANSHH